MFFFTKHKTLRKSLAAVVGFRPKKIELYQEALKHASQRKSSADCYERLEFLGDAVLGMMVAEYLYEQYPGEQEGFLTELRSRLVNREQLTALAVEMGLMDFVSYKEDRKNHLAHKSLPGDVLEAIIGAIYLDRGLKHCRSFFLERMIGRHVDMQELRQRHKNFKSLLLEHCQKSGIELTWNTKGTTGKNHNRVFCSAVLLDGEKSALGEGLTKKKAEQAASELVCRNLGLL